MTFYEAMQLGTPTLKPLINNTDDEGLKKKYKSALITKTILCIFFCMIFISLFSSIFGAENSIVGVVGVILLLTFRFSNLDFNIKQASISLFLIFISFIILPLIASTVNPVLGAIINFISILGLTVLCCHNTLYSNQSVIILSYLLLYGNPISTKLALINRSIALVFCGVLISGIFYFKNRKKKFDNSFIDVIRDFSFTNDRTKWQIKLALSISTGMLIGQLLGIPRVMWIGFTCMSIIQPVKEKLEERLTIRPMYCIVGCILFGIVYTIFPEGYKSFIGILGGLLVGLSATYNWQTVFNCFGAVGVAIPIYGFGGAIILRILANTFGAIYSKVFNYAFEKIYDVILVNNRVADY